MLKWKQVILQRAFLLFLGVLLTLTIISPAVPAQAEEVAVHGVLFFSPTCGHCHLVMDEVLPPLMDKYKDQLVLVSIDISTQEGNNLFSQTIERFQVSPDRRGVPMLIVGETVLVGSYEIPNMLPEMVEAGLAEGGIPWPDIPGLDVSQPVETNRNEKAGFLETFNQDRTANILAVAVLAGMVFSIIWIGYAYLRSLPSASGSWPEWIIPVLSSAGLLISGYLSYIEITQTEAICGPVGNCNAVQSSSYARLFGWLPIGVLGLVGYLLILAMWQFQSSSSQERKRLAITLIWLLALAGTLFSIYLTFLEPFVIGATCLWCITSAIIMTVLLWASSGPALRLLRVKTSRRRPNKTLSRK
jgi:uncharacterized membrane protein